MLRCYGQTETLIFPAITGYITKKPTVKQKISISPSCSAKPKSAGRVPDMFCLTVGIRAFEAWAESVINLGSAYFHRLKGAGSFTDTGEKRNRGTFRFRVIKLISAYVRSVMSVRTVPENRQRHRNQRGMIPEVRAHGLMRIRSSSQ